MKKTEKAIESQSCWKKYFALGKPTNSPFVERDRKKREIKKQSDFEWDDGWKKEKKGRKRNESNFAFSIDYSYERDMNNRFNADA